jgi:sigma-B regulation protein RsbU (phosphoserine phosphatase)
MIALATLMDSQLRADEVLRAYHHDAPLMFLSAAFITVGVIAAAFCLIRRRFDPLLIFLAMFAYLYGQRLRLDSELLGMTMAHGSAFFRLRAAVNYLVPIPAFAFFEAGGFLGRWGKTIVIALSIFFLSLVVGVLFFGPLHQFQVANSVVVILAVPAVALRSQLMRGRDPDFAAIRIGLACFVAGSLWDNIVGTFIHRTALEPYCFAVLLASLGYVAARRLLLRDRELGEMRGEMETARRMQLSILPAAFPESPHFRVGARYVPMSSVAGDFYDFLRVEPARAGILIADVSGHGVPAALIASMVKIAASSQSDLAAEPAMLLAGMNTALCGNTQDQFVTAAYVHLDAEAKELRYAAAGHPAMLLLRAGEVREIVENGFILGITRAATYTQASVALETGDRLILYTDGIVEARDSAGQMFSEERLHALVKETGADLPEATASRIVEAVQAWSKEQDDDLTVIVCDFTVAEIDMRGVVA